MIVRIITWAACLVCEADCVVWLRFTHTINIWRADDKKSNKPRNPNWPNWSSYQGNVPITIVKLQKNNILAVNVILYCIKSFLICSAGIFLKQCLSRSRGFNSNIRTLFTPLFAHPYIFIENKSKNIQMNNVGRNKLIAAVKSKMRLKMAFQWVNN